MRASLEGTLQIWGGAHRHRRVLTLAVRRKRYVHPPGIEPGSPAWQAEILPLDHGCLSDRAASCIRKKQNTIKGEREGSNFFFFFHLAYQCAHYKHITVGRLCVPGDGGRGLACLGSLIVLLVCCLCSRGRSGYVGLARLFFFFFFCAYRRCGGGGRLRMNAADHCCWVKKRKENCEMSRRKRKWSTTAVCGVFLRLL